MAENFFAQFDEEPSNEQNFFAQFDEQSSSSNDSETNEGEGVPKELLEGVITGASKIVQGPLELAASGIDAIAGTDVAGEITDAFEESREYLGLDPVGFAGRTPELVTQFGGGALAVPKVARALTSKVKKQFVKPAAKQKSVTAPVATKETRGEKLKRWAKNSGIAGASDFVVATDDTGSIIEDFFSGGVSDKDQEIGLSGRKKAAENFKDRLLIGAEGAAAAGVILGAVVPGVKALAGTKAAKSTGQAVSQSTVGQKYQDITKSIGDYGRNLEEAFIFGQDSALGRSAKGQARAALNQDPLNFAEKTLVNVVSKFKYRGLLPEEIAVARLLTNERVKPYLTAAERSIKTLQADVDSTLAGLSKGDSELKTKEIFSNISEYLTGRADQLDDLYKAIPNTVNRKTLDGMRKQVKDLTQEGILSSALLKKNDFVTPDGVSIKEIIENNLNGYLTRKYELFESAKFIPDEEALLGASAFMKSNKKFVEDELTRVYNADVSQLKELDAQTLDKFGARASAPSKSDLLEGLDKGRVRLKDGAQVSDELADWSRNKFLQRMKNLNSSRAYEGGLIPAMRQNTNMLLERKDLPKALRKLMGEVDDPRSAFLTTISDLAHFKAADDYFSTISQLAKNNEGIGKMFVDPENFRAAGQAMTPAELKGFLDRGYVQLGSGQASAYKPGELAAGVKLGDDADALMKKANDELVEEVDRGGWGVLNGYLVPKEVYGELTERIMGRGNNKIVDVAIGAYSGLMKLKGISQYSKTVLSPTTQIRNFLSGSMFAVMQGNVGRAASLAESMNVVLYNMGLKSSDELAAELADLQRKGLIGTSTNLQEMQGLIQGLARKPGPSSLYDYTIGALGELGGKAARTKLKVGKVGINANLKELQQGAQKLYQGSDDFWKIYNYKFEKGKLGDAMRALSLEDQYRYLTKGADMPPNVTQKTIDDLIDDRSAQIVRDTVPNYAKAPEVLRFARTLPLGNFISFPYEIYRTGFNTIGQAFDEMASGIPSVAKIGRRRMIGAVTTTSLLPAGLATAAHTLTGISPEEMEAYKRSFGAPWEKGAKLIPLGRDKNGHIQYINFSTFTPYDTLTRFGNRMMSELDNAERIGKDPAKAKMTAAVASLSEAFRPFYEPSMVLAAFNDIVVRGGRTATGARVWNTEDDALDITAKFSNHMLSTLLPSAIPVNVSSGQIVPSRYLRAVSGALGTENIISSKDKLGREQELGGKLILSGLGFRAMSIDPNFQLRVKGSEFGRRQGQAKRKFNSVADDMNVSSPQLLNAYKEANAAKLRVDEEMFQMFEDARMLDVTDSQLNKIIKRNGITGAKKVKKGKFEPFKVSSQIKKIMRRNGTYDVYPRREIADLYREYRKINLTKDDEASFDFFSPVESILNIRDTDPVPGSFPSPTARKGTSTPAVPPVNFFSQFDNTPTPVAQPIDRTNVSPSLLGDPRNADILNRSS